MGKLIWMSCKLYLDDKNDTETKELFKRSEDAGADALVFTVDSPANGNRHRAARFGVGSAYVSSSLIGSNGNNR